MIEHNRGLFLLFNLTVNKSRKFEFLLFKLLLILELLLSLQDVKWTFENAHIWITYTHHLMVFLGF